MGIFDPATVTDNSLYRERKKRKLCHWFLMDQWYALDKTGMIDSRLAKLA